MNDTYLLVKKLDYIDCIKGIMSLCKEDKCTECPIYTLCNDIFTVKPYTWEEADERL